MCGGFRQFGHTGTCTRFVSKVLHLQNVGHIVLFFCPVHLVIVGQPKFKQS